MLLDPEKDYGFTDLWIKDTRELPVWDLFRLEKIHEIFKTCPKIIDFGNSSRMLSELFAEDLKGKERLSVDINACYHPEVVADICNLSMFDRESVDGIICAAILEHVYDPFKAASELYRVLKTGGKMFVYVPWVWNYHSPGTKEFFDFYRYSCDGVRYLFREFPHVELSPVRGRIETFLNLFQCLGKGSRFHKYFGRLIRKYDQYNEQHTSGFNIFIVK